MKSLINDSTTGKPCNAKIWFSLVSAVIVIRFGLADLTVGNVVFGGFDAAGASMLIAAFGGVYGWRAHEKRTQQ